MKTQVTQTGKIGSNVGHSKVSGFTRKLTQKEELAQIKLMAFEVDTKGNVKRL